MTIDCINKLWYNILLSVNMIFRGKNEENMRFGKL